MTDIRKLLEAALENSQHISESTDADERARGKAIGDAFTAIVDALRSPVFPSEPIRNLADRLWHLINKKIVKVGMWPGVKTLTFTVAADENGRAYAVILIPGDWLASLKEDEILGMGGVVFVGCQAVDYASGASTKPNMRTDWLARSRAYEAEYLLLIQRYELAYRLNEYQRDLLRQYPEGLKQILS